MGTLTFIFGSLFLIYTIIAVLVSLFKKHYLKTKKIIVRALALTVCYFIVLIFVSLFSKENILTFNQEKCFDEWCVTVTKVDKNIDGNNNTYRVTLKISNNGKGRSQRPDHPHFYIEDSNGISYETTSNEGRPIDDQINAQTSFDTYLNFSIPKDSKAKLVFTEGGGPTLVIIGDEQSLLHKKSVLYLD